MAAFNQIPDEFDDPRIAHVYDNLPNDIPEEWGKPPEACSQNFTTATNGERVISQLLGAKRLLEKDSSLLLSQSN